MSYLVISASEIGEYIYCRRSWWLRRTARQQPDDIEHLVSGLIYHESHEFGVRQAEWARRVSLILIFMAVSVIAFWLVSAL